MRGRIGADEILESAGYDIRSLSRFVAAQRTGFYKLLKKYKKWTGSEHLSNRFIVKLESNSSFFRPDFDGALVEYSEILGAVRMGLARRKEGDEGAEVAIGPGARLTAARPENSASFWIHGDHLIEVQILLLQHLEIISSASSSGQSTGTATPVASRPNGLAGYSSHKGDTVTTVLFDDLKRLSKIQGSVTIEDESRSALRTAAQLRWSTTHPDVEILVSDLLPSDVVLTLDREQVQGLLDPTSEHAEDGQSELATDKNRALVREWFRTHRKIAPLAKLVARRAIFAGDTSGSQVRVTLDKDIKMLATTTKFGWLDDDDDLSGNNKSMEFPHAVCDVSWTGREVPGFVRELKSSHLVEYVPGFSLDMHAIATLYQPKNMTRPHWFRALDTDIRKTPTDQQQNRHSRHHSRQNTSRAYSSACSSTESTIAGGLTDNTTSNETALSSAPPSDAGSVKFKHAYKPRSAMIETINGQRYWNELAGDDDDSDGAAPYTILVGGNHSDSDEDEKTLSGYVSHGVTKMFRKMRHPLRKKQRRGTNERTALLDRTGAHDTDSSDEENAAPLPPTLYRSYHEAEMYSDSNAYGTKHIWFMLLSVLIMIFTGALALHESLKQRKHPGKHTGRRMASDLGAVTGAMGALISGVVAISMFLMGGRASIVHAVFVWGAFAAICIGAGAIIALVGRTEVGG